MPLNDQQGSSAADDTPSGHQFALDQEETLKDLNTSLSIPIATYAVDRETWKAATSRFREPSSVTEHLKSIGGTKRIADYKALELDEGLEKHYATIDELNKHIRIWAARQNNYINGLDKALFGQLAKNKSWEFGPIDSRPSETPGARKHDYSLRRVINESIGAASTALTDVGEKVADLEKKHSDNKLSSLTRTLRQRGNLLELEDAMRIGNECIRRYEPDQSIINELPPQGVLQKSPDTGNPSPQYPTRLEKSSVPEGSQRRPQVSQSAENPSPEYGRTFRKEPLPGGSQQPLQGSQTAENPTRGYGHTYRKSPNPAPHDSQPSRDSQPPRYSTIYPLAAPADLVTDAVHSSAADQSQRRPSGNTHNPYSRAHQERNPTSIAEE